MQERLILGSSSIGDSSALVDVGGGAGLVLDDFRKAVPWPGRLVLQEQEMVIQIAREAGLPDSIELQAHDFFTEQPLKGARAYHLRYILHDWSDEKSLQILGHLKDAMTPGYSKILINECVLADKGASWQHVSLDMFMMALCSSHERTETEWRALINKAGLRIAGIWSGGASNESVIEVIL